MQRLPAAAFAAQIGSAGQPPSCLRSVLPFFFFPSHDCIAPRMRRCNNFNIRPDLTGDTHEA